MDTARARELSQLYRKELMDNVIPFWEQRAPDPQYGGFFHCFDRDGTLYDTTKYVWCQGRFVWMFSRLYQTVEPRREWLEAARQGLEFLRQHCFSEEGRMYFAVTQEGQRLYQPWGLFSECFAIIALSRYGQASGEAEAIAQAQQLFWSTLELSHRSDLDSLSYPEIPPVALHAVPMQLLSIAQELRQAQPDPAYEQVIDEMLERILRHHAHPEERAVFENVSLDGSLLDSPEGRVLLPGHALESAWFVLEEARHRQDQALVEGASAMIEWSLERGWDEQYGGLLYFVDSQGLPSPFLEWDMKLWWVHLEALYALLLGHHLTGRQDFLDWFERIHAWTWEHYPDPQYGEWLGYLHRTGEVALSAKGSMWKGFYHLPRALLLIAELLEEISA